MSVIPAFASVEADPRALAEVLLQAGTMREVAGNTPFLLRAADRVTYIAEGSVDLFLTEVSDEAAQGIRHYCCTLSAGDGLFGIPCEDDLLDVALLAVGTVGTRVVDLPVAVLHAIARQPRHRQALGHLIERWVIALSEVGAQAIVPPPPVPLVLVAGDAVAVGGGRRAGAAAGVVWARADDDGALYLDGQEVPAGVPFPLTQSTWLSLGPNTAVACEATDTVLADGRVWGALTAFHASLIEAGPLMLRLAAADEANRLRDRLAADEGTVARGLAGLSAIVRRQGSGHDLHAPEDALFAACAAIAGQRGLTLTQPALRPGAVAPDLDSILGLNRLRKREILLESNWWCSEIGSFLLMPDEGAPVAVLKTRRGYALWPGNAVLTARSAASLRGKAFTLYDPLPDKALDLRAMAGIILTWGRVEFIVIMGFGALGSLLALATPVATGLMVDTLIPNSDMPGLAQMAGLLAVIACLQLMIGLTVQRASLRLEGVAGARLQAAVIDRLLRLPARFFQDFSTGDLATRALAIQRIEAVLTGSTIGSLMTGCFALTSFGLMVYYSLPLGALAVGIGLVYAAAIASLGIARTRREREVIRLRGAIAGFLLEATTGIAKLRLAAAESRAFGRWAVQFADMERRVNAVKQIDILNELLGLVVPTLSIALLFGLVLYAGLESGLALGVLIAFLAAFGQAINGIAGLSKAALDVIALRPVLEHAAPILTARPEVVSGDAAEPGELTGAIEISRLTFRYAPDGPAVLNDLTLQIRAGEYVALVGPSGCGKSTVLRLLLGFEMPETGAVLYDGRDLRGLNVGSVRRQMGVVLQSSRLTGPTLLENILGANLALGEAAAWRAADAAGLVEDIEAMPMGMHTMVGEGALSGGQLQRVAIARALVNTPSIVLFDEATSALDNRTQAVVIASLERMRATRIVVAHRLSTVVKADRIVVLRDGQVQESGSYESLVQSSAFFRDLVSRQVVDATEAA